ncbi:MAG: hypothetical protein IJ589_00010 [Lachnospiraceae bacterium]|nr:hypothetical protein [Lachnospiraceae bacterium]
MEKIMPVNEARISLKVKNTSHGLLLKEKSIFVGFYLLNVPQICDFADYNDSNRYVGAMAANVSQIS